MSLLEAKGVRVLLYALLILLLSASLASSQCSLTKLRECSVSQASGIFVSNDIAYLTSSATSALNVVPLSTLAVSSLSVSNPSWDVYVSGSSAYLTQGSGIEVVNSVTGADLGYCPNWDPNLFAIGIYISGSYAYVGATDGASGKLVVLSLANPNSPSVVSTIITANPIVSYGGGLCVSGTKIYLATDSGIDVYDIGNPTLPAYVGAYAVPGGPYDVHVFNNKAYIAIPSGSPSIQVRDLSNWGVIENCYIDTDSPYAVQFYGGKIYVADTAGLKELGLGSGSIAIAVHPNIQTAQTFGFDGDLGSFTLDDNSDPIYSSSKTFTSMAGGDYIIHQIVPAGWILSSITASDPTKVVYSSDGGSWHVIRAADDTYAKATVSAGGSLTVTFADTRLCSISGHVVYDLDGSGGKNNLESYVPNGWKLELYKDGTKIKDAATSNGAYSFGNLQSGNYEVRSILPTGWSNTLPSEGRRSYPGLFLDQVDQDFGARGGLSVSGTVFYDWNSNGAIETGETALAGMTVQLVNTSSNSVIAQNSSGADGAYQFSFIAPGSYWVQVQPPDYWQATNSPISMPSLAASVSGQNLGLQGTLSISGIKFYDRNGNGLQDGGEEGLSSWRIYNDINRDGNFQAGETFSLTGPDGSYNLTGLSPGSYRIREENQSGYFIVSPTAGYYDVILTNAKVVGKNFANSRLSTISGRVWDDANYSGLQDSGEPGLASVGVQLCDSSGNSLSPPQTSTTNGSGGYSFTILPGSYRIRFTLPAGKVFSPKNQGGDNTADSDADAAGRTDVITVAAEQDSLHWDAGMYENRIIINEIYPNPVGSDNQAGTASWERVELKNIGSVGCNVGGWTIKDDDGLLATIPAGTIIPAGGYLVVHIGGPSAGISNSAGDPVNLSDSSGALMQLISCPASSSKEGLSYSRLPDASDNWNFWGDPTLGGALSSDPLPGAPNMGMDYGDAPDSFNTTRARDGARHFLTGPSLGSNVDGDLDGQPGAGADGDGADEDGASFSGIIAGLSSEFNVTASGPGLLQAWMDFNGDGSFGAGEQIASDRSLSAGEQTISFSVPGGAKTGFSYARLRFSSQSGLGFLGPAPDGEVEDYRVEIHSACFLGDLVWEDLDGNGLQGDMEPGLPGVTVNLKDLADNIVSSNTTAAGGEYLFVNPAPGAYVLEFLPSAGYSFTIKDAGADDSLDSDADPATHKTGPITVAAGQSNRTLDAGLYQPASIAGMKFNDRNAGGSKDPGESGISGWRIYLDLDADGAWNQTVEPSIITDPTGFYSFSGLAPGVYRVSEVIQSGWVQSFPSASAYDEIIFSGQTANDRDFGNHVLFGLFIAGKKTNETGAPKSGWSINLTGTTFEGDAVSRQTVTGSDGRYNFTDLRAGSYNVSEEDRAGWVHASPISQTFNLTASKQNIDFINRLASGLFIAGKKTNETGAAKSGWSISLTGTTLEGASVSKQAVTGSDGKYNFTSLLAGSYTVTEETRAGWEPTSLASQSFDLTASKQDVDFVNRLASGLFISGQKRNETSAPKSGWAINLNGTTLDGDAVFRQTITGSDGRYNFTDLQAGSYTVTEEDRAGWVHASPASQSFDLTASRQDVDFVNRLASGLFIAGQKRNEIGAAKSGWSISLVGTTLDGDAISRQTITGSDGRYNFTDLQAGSYTVSEEDRAGWVHVSPASQSFDLTASRQDVDFVNRLASSIFIAGKKTNETGAPKSGWSINLTGTTIEGDTVSRQTATGSDGRYNFTNLQAGSYTVSEEDRAGWVPSSPASQSFDLTTSRQDVDFVNRLASGLFVSGKVITESGVPEVGWTLYLSGFTLEGEIISGQILTSSDGSYNFMGLQAGTYTVSSEVRPDWPVLDPASGSHSMTLLTSGAPDKDFIVGLRASILGCKFEDKDGDGQQGQGEPGLEGWTIRLHRPDGTVSTATTIANGSYAFPDLLAEGSYTLEEVAQDGWQQTAPQGGNYSLTLVASSAGGFDFGNRRILTGMNVSMTIDPAEVLQGDRVSLTSTVRGQGAILPETLDAVQTLPEGLKFVSATPSPQNIAENPDGTSTITWTGLIAGSDPLAKLVVQASARAQALGEYTSLIRVNGTSSQAIIEPASARASLKVLSKFQPVSLTKSADLDVVWQGGYVTYTIGYQSNVDMDLTGVVITEQAPQTLEFVSASPSPDADTDNTWSIGVLPGHASGKIKILYRVKERANLTFTSQSRVEGSGFANARRSLSTETKVSITNSVTLVCNEFPPVSASHTVKLRDGEGTAILEKEHGSGELESEEEMVMKMEKRSVRTEGSLVAEYHPSSFSLPGGRQLTYSSLEAASVATRNRGTSTSSTQSFRYARSIDLDRRLLLDRNETDLATEASVEGQAFLGMTKKEGEAARLSPVFQSSQDYQGSFRINGSLEDYGDNVRLASNTSGQGRAASDIRLRDSQRIYQHGSGSYEAEEQASSAESYLARDLNLISDPLYSYGKWKAGIWSRSPGKSFLSQEITGADYIHEETIAGGLSDMSTNMSFLGAARLRAASQLDGDRELDLDESYVGEYSISRKVHLGGISRFNRPHITLTKEGRIVNRTTNADYKITVENDGNAALGPVYVWDDFPAGTDYLESSLKPGRLEPGYANWTLLYLGIGQAVTIDLRLNLTDPMNSLTNRVYASGGHDDEWIYASNLSTISFGWLGCCQSGLESRIQARINSSDPWVILYRILLHNRGNASLAARVTDTLPAGLQFLHASLEPQDDGRTLTWVTEEIAPGGDLVIEYQVKALQEGRYVNTAAVESYPVDGSEGGSARVSSMLVVGNQTSFAEDGWRPPEWGLDRSDVFDTIVDSVAGGEAGDGDGSCPAESCPP